MARVTAEGEIRATLERLAAIDEVALVAAPTILTPSVRSDIVDHCVNSADRFALLDCGETLGSGVDPNLTAGGVETLQQGIEQGIEQGLEQGMQQGGAKMLRR